MNIKKILVKLYSDKVISDYYNNFFIEYLEITFFLTEY